nr:endogenous retrovirus group K member 113 Gag polyprotein-like isoform X2 [Caretta caretta]
MRHSVSPRKGPLQHQQRGCRSRRPRPLLQPSLPLLHPQCLYYHRLPGLPHRSRCVITLPPVGPPGGSSASAQKLSLVQQMVHAAKARSDLTAEELADLVSVCPVTWQNDDQGNPVGTWTTLSYSVVREVRKAIREFGLTSTFVRGLVEGIGTGYSLIPEDWKTLLRMMLSPSQYVIWLSEYRQMAERQAQGWWTLELTLR